MCRWSQAPSLRPGSWAEPGGMQAEEGVAVPHSPARSSVSPSSLDPDPLSITTACPHIFWKIATLQRVWGGDSCLYKTGTNRTVTYFVTKESFFFSLLMECAIFKSCLPEWQLPWTHWNNVPTSFSGAAQRGNFVVCIFIVMKIFYDGIWISTTKDSWKQGISRPLMQDGKVAQVDFLLGNMPGIGLFLRDARNPGSL